MSFGDDRVPHLRFHLRAGDLGSLNVNYYQNQWIAPHTLVAGVIQCRVVETFGDYYTITAAWM